MYSNIIQLMSGSSMMLTEDIPVVQTDSGRDSGRYQGTILGRRVSAAHEARQHIENWRNSDFLKFGQSSQPMTEFEMDWRCNFATEFASPETSVSALNDNWYKEGHHSRVDAEHSTVPLDTFSFEGCDIIDTEEAIHLPRQFIPQGLDWDYRFEETDYGTDVVLVSESEHSADTMAGGPSSASQKRANSKLMTPNSNNPSHSSLPTGREMRPRSISELSRSSNWKIAREKKEGEKKKKVLVESTKIAKETNSFLVIMDDIRYRAKTMSGKQLQVLEAQRKLNDEVRKNAPRFSDQSWDVDDSQANVLMRKGTLENFNFGVYRKSTDQNPYSLDGVMLMTMSLHRKRSPPYTRLADSSMKEEKLQQLKRVTRELATLDLRRHIVLSDKDMAGFCYANYNNTRDLVLQGKEVYNITGRRVQDFDLPYIFTYLVANQDIVYLDLSYNQITITGAWYIMDFLSWNTSLLGLNLMNNDIDALDSHMIDALCENTTLKSLRLNGNPLGKKGGEYIAFLLMFKELEHLDLGQTDQTVESLAWISQALMQSTTLKVLDLSRVLGYQGYVSDTLHFALAFSDILRFCESLEELHLGKNSLTDVDLEQLLFGLSFNKRLELLDLACNRIGDHGAEMIAGALHCGAPLKAIILNTNRIGNPGARALSLKLPMSQIKFLDLSVNQITDQGIIDIVYTIRKPYPILALFIFGNKINARALEVLQGLILSGDLNPESLDITVFYMEGVIGHGHNAEADRYRPRYYKVPVNTQSEKFMHKVNEHKPCRPECIDYKFHNVVNVCGFPQPVASNNLGPSCPV